MDIIINDSLDGRSVLDIIRRELGVSRATLKHLKFMENGIMLNGVHVTVRRTVSTGDVLSIAVEDAQSPAELTPSDISLDIAYEDDNVVVPSVPPGKRSELPVLRAEQGRRHDEPVHQ